MSTQLHFRSITLSAWKSVVSIIESLSLLLRVAFLLSGVFRPNANSICTESTPNVTLKFLQLFLSQLFPLPPQRPHRLKQLLQLDNRLFLVGFDRVWPAIGTLDLSPIFSTSSSQSSVHCASQHDLSRPICNSTNLSRALLSEIYSKVTFSPYILSLSLAPYMHSLHISVVVSASVTKIFQKLLHYARHLPAKWI